MEQNHHARYLVQANSLVVLLILVIALVVEKGEDVLALNGAHTFSFDVLFYYVTALGNGLMIFVFVGLALFQSFRFALSLMTSSAAIGMLCYLLKRLLAMPRPVRVLEPGQIHVVFDVSLNSTYSMPSGHTAFAFGMAIVWALYCKNKVGSTLMLLLAILVGLSRMYLGQHFLIDVSVGAMLGSICAWVVNIIITNINAPWLDRRIAMAWPEPLFPKPHGK